MTYKLAPSLGLNRVALISLVVGTSWGSTHAATVIPIPALDATRDGTGFIGWRSESYYWVAASGEMQWEISTGFRTGSFFIETFAFESGAMFDETWHAMHNHSWVLLNVDVSDLAAVDVERAFLEFLITDNSLSSHGLGLEAFAFTSDGIIDEPAFRAADTCFSTSDWNVGATVALDITTMLSEQISTGNAWFGLTLRASVVGPNIGAILIADPNSVALRVEHAAPVPEPSSLAIFAGLGVMGMIAARYRRDAA